MFVLRMMLRLFTTIFGTTHPKPEDEDKYALLLVAMVVLLGGMLGITVWMVTRFAR